MEIKLSAEMERYLRDRLARGEFPSADAMVEAAMRMMHDADYAELEAVERMDEELERLRALLERGESLTGDVALENLRSKLRRYRGAA